MIGGWKVHEQEKCDGNDEKKSNNLEGIQQIK